MTGGVEGRPVDRERGWVKYLKPGQRIVHRVTITATDDKDAINRLLKLNK